MRKYGNAMNSDTNSCKARRGASQIAGALKVESTNDLVDEGLGHHPAEEAVGNQ